MLQDTLSAARDTVVAASSSGFDAMDFVKTIVGAIIIAVTGYFGGKHGAQKGTGRI